ncbi:hypothetical protein AB0395_01280 [Streptosporangium sp. NPDC051023]|uniref:hypothetical protein n=1 Tax=Streptosporangium sp. NPDC051023 TaxID=3155410 RepID=UPI00344E6310
MAVDRAALIRKAREMGIRITRFFTVGALSAKAIAATPIGSANVAACPPEGAYGEGDRGYGNRG